MRIVTFCAHQPYLYLFKGMDLDMDIVMLERNNRFLQNWNDAVRPLPERWNLIDMQRAQQGLKRGYYQIALAHNINDYIDFMKFKVRRYLVMHTTLSGRLREEKTRIDPDEYKRDFNALVKKTGGKMVFVSKSKQADWGLPGKVIPLVVDVDDYRGYTGEEAAILRVSNQLVERGDILDYPAHQHITRDLPLRLVGHNPKTPGSKPAADWEELKAFYRTHRVYLHTAIVGLEDGYNTAMLEAMGTGMPIVSTQHPTSPIVDGVNGFISDDLDYLREKVQLLLSDRELAERMGAAARATVEKHFHIKSFHQNWRNLWKKR